MPSTLSAPTALTLAALLAVPLVQDPTGAEDPRQDPDTLRAELERLAEEFVAREELEGLSLAVGFGQEPLLARGWGYADAGGGVAATAETQVRLGRLTQLVTAVAALQLVEQERLDLDAKVAELIEGFDVQGRDMRVRHLLGHTSGLPPYSELDTGWEERGRKGYTPEQLRALFEGEPFLFDPGERYEESNSNYTLLALLVEQVAGVDFPTHVRRALLAPQGLYRTVFCDLEPRPAVAGGEPDAAGEGEDGQGEARPVAASVTVPRFPRLGSSDAVSTEELCSTAADLYGFVRALVARELLDEAALQLLSGPVELAGGGTSPHGFGLRRDESDGVLALVDAGEPEGDRAVLAHYPDSELTIVVLAHGAAAGEEGLADAFRRRLARAALGLPEPGIVDQELSDEERELYAGQFQLGSTLVEIVARDDGRLWFERPGAGDLRLRHQGRGVFVGDVGTDTRLTFRVPPEGGPADSFVLSEGGFESIAKRFDQDRGG